MPKSVSEAAEDYAKPSEGTDNGTMPLALKSAFLAGANWMREQFTLYGTDDCLICDDGRTTLYATLEGRCIKCAHEREVRADE